MATKFDYLIDMPNQDYKCDICKKKINPSEGFVYWHFNENKIITLHRDCATELSTKLGFDSIKLKYEQRDRIIPNSKNKKGFCI